MLNEQIKPHPLSRRPRRLRRLPNLRRIVRETLLTPADFIQPLFVRYGDDQKLPIASMPGQFQLSVDKLKDEARVIADLGIPAVILFGIPERKDWCGSDNFSSDGIVPRAIREIKNAVPDLVVISDMCFCEYTEHGHCGVVNTPGNAHFDPNLPLGYLLNDPTLELLQRASIVHAKAGADFIAPSGMIDGMVGAIRQALDHNSLELVALMSYAAKFASAFYGPFREAAGSSPGFGDRNQYQLDPANSREALHEVSLDIDQGADIVMVKPALPSLDILKRLRQTVVLPLAAYQVSGEYAMLHAAADRGWLDLESVALESLTAIKRSGADLIVSYFSKAAVTWLE